MPASLPTGLDVPFEQLAPETLHALIEEFVTRDGTDYGTQEASMERKVTQVMELLRKKKAKIVFDPQTESCDIREIV